mgnify:CR=1 FL=1
MYHFLCLFAGLILGLCLVAFTGLFSLLLARAFLFPVLVLMLALLSFGTLCLVTGTAGLSSATALATAAGVATSVYGGDGSDTIARRTVELYCRLLGRAAGDLAKLLAEAEAKGLPLCSRCPGSSTPGKGNP